MLPATLAVGGISILMGVVVLAAVALSAFMAEPTIPGPQDEQLLLQNTVTQTATANSAGLDMGSGYAPGGVGQTVAAVIQVTAADRANSDETYTFRLQESADNAAWSDMGANVAVATAGATATLGTYVAKGVLTKRFVRLAMTATGTTPSITYKAWLNPRNVA